MRKKKAKYSLLILYIKSRLLRGGREAAIRLKEIKIILFEEKLHIIS
jgi:hypothetical protein